MLTLYIILGIIAYLFLGIVSLGLMIRYKEECAFPGGGIEILVILMWPVFSLIALSIATYMFSESSNLLNKFEEFVRKK